MYKNRRLTARSIINLYKADPQFRSIDWLQAIQANLKAKGLTFSDKQVEATLKFYLKGAADHIRNNTSPIVVVLGLGRFFLPIGKVLQRNRVKMTVEEFDQFSDLLLKPRRDNKTLNYDAKKTFFRQREAQNLHRPETSECQHFNSSLPDNPGCNGVPGSSTEQPAEIAVGSSGI